MNGTGRKFAILVCSIVAIGGCADAESITAPPRMVSGTPAFDTGGGWFGTGNRTDSTATTPSSSSQGGTVVTADGGGWFGTGN
jgi:hypothetical protein